MVFPSSFLETPNETSPLPVKLICYFTASVYKTVGETIHDYHEKVKLFLSFSVAILQKNLILVVWTILTNGGDHVKQWFQSWGRALLEAGLILGILFLFFWPVNIDGRSMENSFFHGDKVAVSRLMTVLPLYETGDIVVFSGQVDGEKKFLIKRVIGMPGDHVVISEGTVYVNDTKLVEEYAKGETSGAIDLIVPEDSLFVLGDNRENSYDSRDFGILPESDLHGRVVMRFYPFSDISFYFK